MSEKHPYVSGTGVLTQVLDHLRKSFPATLNSDVLKKLGFAPKNESYIINTFRFLNLIAEDGARTKEAQKAFVIHDDDAFREAFAEIVMAAYSDLFSLHGENAWSVDLNKLITFFRQTDHSSQLVGGRQAGTFRALAAYAGRVEGIATPKAKVRPQSKAVAQKVVAKKASGVGKPPVQIGRNTVEDSSSLMSVGNGVGLTVRIEINLPATGDQDTYDKIFKSIRENLLNG